VALTAIAPNIYMYINDFSYTEQSVMTTITANKVDADPYYQNSTSTHVTSQMIHRNTSPHL